MGFGPLQRLLPEPMWAGWLAPLSCPPSQIWKFPEVEEVWKTKLKAKTGLFVFKRQHALVEIIAEDKWDEGRQGKVRLNSRKRALTARSMAPWRGVPGGGLRGDIFKT